MNTLISALRLPQRLFLTLVATAVLGFSAGLAAGEAENFYKCPHGIVDGTTGKCPACKTPVGVECARARAALMAVINERARRWGGEGWVSGYKAKDIQKMDCGALKSAAGAWTDFKDDSEIASETRGIAADEKRAREKAQREAEYAANKQESDARSAANKQKHDEAMKRIRDAFGNVGNDGAKIATDSSKRIDPLFKQGADIVDRIGDEIVDQLDRPNRVPRSDDGGGHSPSVPQQPRYYLPPSVDDDAPEYIPSLPPLRNLGPSPTELAEQARREALTRAEADVALKKQQADDQLRDRARQILEAAEPPHARPGSNGDTPGVDDLTRFDSLAASPGPSAPAVDELSRFDQLANSVAGHASKPQSSANPPIKTQATDELTRFDVQPLRKDGDVRHIPAAPVIGKSDPAPPLLFTLGVQSSAANHNALGDRLAIDTGADVYVVYNKPTSGLGEAKNIAADTLRSPRDEVANEAITSMGEQLQQQLKSGAGPIHMVVHSEGEIIAAQAMMNVKVKMIADGVTPADAAKALERVRIVSFGGGWSGEPTPFKGLGSYNRVYHEDDAVALGAHGLRNLQPQANVGDAHSFDKTYYPVFKSEGIKLFEQQRGDIVIGRDGKVRYSQVK